MDALTITNLRKQYRGGRGVTDVSLTLAPGGVYGLLGANGAGKTTTMKAIAGLVRKDAGEIRVFGEDIDENPAKSRLSMGCLIETPALYGYMSAEGNLRAAASYYPGVTIADIREKLAAVGLADTGRLKAKAFSLGMKQRLGLALAMLNNPSLYILDEPANGLDIDGIIDVREAILRLAKEGGAAFLVSSHQAAEVEKLCDHVGVIHNGRLAASATVADALAQYPSLEEYYLAQIRGEQP